MEMKIVLVHFKFVWNELQRKKLLVIWGTKRSSPNTTTFNVSSLLVAQPCWRGSPSIETLIYQRKESPSAEQQDGNKRESLVQAWAPEDFGERAPAKVRQIQSPPKAVPQLVMAATSCALAGSVSVPEPSSPLFHLTSTVQFSRSVVSDSLRPRESQHTRPPCLSPTPRVYSNSCPSSWWCHPAISSSVVPFSSCPQSLPASGSFPTSQLFAWGGQSIGVSASASVLSMNTQD